MNHLDRLTAALDHGIDITGRRVFLHGGVDEETIGTAIRGIYLLADLSDSPIELYVSSYGGELDEAFALHDVTRTVKVPVHTVALGKCMSAAPMLVACGTQGHRYATESTLFMLHGVSISELDGSSTEDLRATADVTEKMVERYARLLARYSRKRDRRFWLRLFASKVDRYFDAEQALAWGLIDQIWSEK